jgi:zinc transporter, ZIP family
VGAGAVFVAALGTALATGLGALPFALARRPSQAWLGTANALAAGSMAGASLGLVWEGSDYDAARVAVGLACGAASIALAGKLLGRDHHRRFGTASGADARQMFLIVGVMTAHSVTEGIGVGVSFGGGERLGLVIALAIAIHNIPEGLAISLVLVPRGVGVRRAAAWSVFSSLPQPLLAVPAFLFVEAFRPLLPLGLGFAAGAMLWMAAVDLVPEAVRVAPPWRVAFVATLAAAAMLALQATLL